MTHYLRTQDNQTIMECDVYNNDLSTAVNLGEYSKLLLKYGTPLDPSFEVPIDKSLFVFNFMKLNDLRTTWWERLEDSGKYRKIDDFVSEMYRAVASLYDLNYVTD